jgi:iron complex transport system ATP-binding protein
MIDVSHITLTLSSSQVLRDVNCTFVPGRITAIIGPNGAGKTSLIRLIAGLVAPTTGRVTLDGAPMASIAPAERARKIGYLPQANQPHWNVTARALISLGRLPHRSALAENEAAIARAMEHTNTAHLADRTIDNMSGGERARVHMARVIAGDPRWILADEPLANLDPPHAQDMLTLCRSAADSGKGVVIVLHQLDAAAQIADDIIILRSGTLLAVGETDDVLTPDLLTAAFDMPFDVFARAGRRIIVPLTEK